jgi:tripeptide aminopeptidase
MKQRALEKFIRYVRINTQSKDDSSSYPSTKCQFDLARVLVRELKQFGLRDARVDSHCYTTATLPANVKGKFPVIGLIAHVDTSPEVPGDQVRPRVIKRYRGGDIVINNKTNAVLKAAETEHLSKCIGHTIVTSDGTTLLGADDKAGVAAIMTAIQELSEHPHIPHGTVKIAFTPDEETGNGVAHFDIKKFGADFAYTVDGGFAGELNGETFSADSALLTVEGRDIHPGYAKGIMVNSIRAMAAIIDRLPKNMAPETTEKYEPYIHPLSMEGGVYKTACKLILRDFKAKGLNAQKKILEDIINQVRRIYPKAKIRLTITESYRNMRQELERHPQVTGRLWNAAKRAGIRPRWAPVRGGTDGSRLTAMGLPTPNIFTGSGNHHSRTEWLSADELVKAAETVINVVRTD